MRWRKIWYIIELTSSHLFIKLSYNWHSNTHPSSYTTHWNCFIFNIQLVNIDTSTTLLFTATVNWPLSGLRFIILRRAKSDVSFLKMNVWRDTLCSIYLVNKRLNKRLTVWFKVWWNAEWTAPNGRLWLRKLDMPNFSHGKGWAVIKQCLFCILALKHFILPSV